MVGVKVKAGIALSRDIVQRLDEVVESSGYLQLNRSELVETILAAFFKGQRTPIEKARELVIMRRKGLI